MTTVQRSKVKSRNWIAIVLLGFSGQIAWVVENSWLNSYVHDIITPDPRVISFMVAASAITATVTTLIMGTLSDRIGKRKAMIFFAYILWGISTILIPLSGVAKSVGIAVFLVVLIDCVLTFFGATANDACFNAWITDITDETNRGFVSGIIEFFPLLAMVITTVVSGIMIEILGYSIFFVSLGAVVIVCGIIGGLSLKEGIVSKPAQEIGFWKQLFSAFSKEHVKQNKKLFAVLTCMLIFTIAFQICMPYQIIYFTKTLGFSYDEIGIYLGSMTLLAGICGVLYGYLVDRIGKPKLMIVALIVSIIGYFCVSLATTMLTLCIAMFVMVFGMIARLVVSGAWIRDLTPEGEVGKIQGIRMVFWVLIPMVIGPFIGEKLIEFFGEAVVVNGRSGYLPSKEIFVAASLVTLLAFIPLRKFLKNSKNREQA
ncbi:MAG: MFS transporter [Eubacteriales bacterium]